MRLKPRPYQQESVDSCWEYLSSGKGKSPLLVEPTGSGKALIISMLGQQANEIDPTVRVVIITDSRELVRQNYAEFVGLWPEAPAGVYSAGLNRRDIRARFLFASIQSIYKRAYQIQRCDILIIDECHMIPFKSDAMYQKLIGDLRAINRELVVIGMTATAYRGNGVPLHGQEGSIFDGVAHETSVTDLFVQGFLCPPISHRFGKGAGEIDSTGVATQAGEFITSQAEAVALEPETVRAMIDQIVAAGAMRRSWKIFGVSTAHCLALHAELSSRGFLGDVVFGHTDTERGKGTRDRIIRQFDTGELRYLISNMTLVKGFNVKRIDMIVLAFITKSVVKYIQSIGRGTRPIYADGYPIETDEQRLHAIANGPKPNCLVLDFGQNITRCGPFDDPFLKDSKGKGGGEAPFKTCPVCECDTATATRLCPECGHEYPPPEKKISITPDEKPILSTEPEWVSVNHVSYAIHSKPGGQDSLRVEYHCGLTVHREWVCFDHTGYARTKAEGWWLRRNRSGIPASVAEAHARACAGELQNTAAIMLRRNGKYDEIAGYQFAPPPAVSDAEGMAA